MASLTVTGMPFVNLWYTKHQRYGQASLPHRIMKRCLLTAVHRLVSSPQDYSLEKIEKCVRVT